MSTQKHVHKYYSRIIHNKQKMKTIHTFIDGGMDLKNVVYPHSGILFDHL